MLEVGPNIVCRHLVLDPVIKPVYFVSKVLVGAELHYWNIEHLALEVMVTTGRNQTSQGE